MIIDSHAHYDDDAFCEDRDRTLQMVLNSGISRIVNIASSRKTCESTRELVQKYDQVYGALGIHPNEVGDINDEDMDYLRIHLCEDKIVALGEIGLDYYYPEPEREIQKEWFIRQLLLAKELSKPVVLHSRDAAEDTLAIVKKHYDNQAFGGVVHCFAYSPEIAYEFCKLGLYLGIGGVVTFQNAKKLKEVVRAIPLEHLVIETDCPYLAPVPFRGKRNTSANLPYVIKEIATIKQMHESEVEEVVYANICRLYGLTKEEHTICQH